MTEPRTGTPLRQASAFHFLGMSLAAAGFWLAASTGALAQTQLTGQTTGGAYYNIMVPDGWTPSAGLVIWNHGFSFAPIGPEPDLGPLAQVQLDDGFAVAASSLRQTGWGLFLSAKDIKALVKVFRAKVGKPKKIFITGESLGGIVTAQAIEAPGLGNVVGALPICGGLAGSRIWDGGVDLRLLYDFVCQGVPGAAIPGGAKGLPEGSNFNGQALAIAVNACTGNLLPPANRTQQQQARLDQFLETTQIPESFLLNDMGFVTFEMTDLFYNPRKMGGKLGYENSNVDYGDPAINAGIERVQGSKAAQRKLTRNYTPTGKIGETKIVALHTDKDGFMLVENESDYASKVPADQFTVAVVQEQLPSHCGFNDAEVLAGWRSLVEWVDGGDQPTATKIQDRCQSIRRVGAGSVSDQPRLRNPRHRRAHPPTRSVGLERRHVRVDRSIVVEHHHVLVGRQISQPRHESRSSERPKGQDPPHERQVETLRTPGRHLGPALAPILKPSTPDATQADASRDVQVHDRVAPGEAVRHRAAVVTVLHPLVGCRQLVNARLPLGAGQPLPTIAPEIRVQVHERQAGTLCYATRDGRLAGAAAANHQNASQCSPRKDGSIGAGLVLRPDWHRYRRAYASNPS